MEQDKTVRDLFPALAVQLERATSETPSVESDGSAISVVQSPTPRANTLQDSATAQGSGSVSRLPQSDIALSTTPYPSLTTEFHQSNGKHISPVSPVHALPHTPLLSSNLENKVESSRQNISSRGTTQVPTTPVRSTGVPPAPVGGDSEEYFPTASNTVSSHGKHCSFIPTRDCQSTNTGSTIAGKRAKDVTPTVVPRLKLVVNEPEDSTNASESPKDVTPTATPRLKLVVNNPPEDSTNASESPKDVTPTATPRLKLVVNNPPEDSTNASESPKDVTPTATPRLKLVVNNPPEDSTNASESPKDVTPTVISRLKLVVNDPPEDSTNASESPKDVTPTVISRLKLVVNDPPEDSTNASESPKDVTPIAIPKLKLVVNNPPEDSTSESDTSSGSANASESPKDVTPTATPRLKLFCKPKPRRSTLESIPETVESDPASSEHLSSPTNLGNQSSNMDPHKPRAESTSYDESPKPSSSKPSSSSDEAPSRDAGNLSPLNFVPTPAMNSSLDPAMDPSMGPYMDPYQPTDPAVMPGISPFEDPNVAPSTFVFPEETPDYSSVPIDPMGVYTPEQYARILASEQDLLREMADMHTDTPTSVYDRRVEQQQYTTVADLDRIFAEMEAACDGIDILQPEYWAAIGRDLSGPSQSGVLASNQPTHAQSASQTQQSVEKAEQGSAKRRARHRSRKAKSSTPEPSSMISTRTSVSNQRGSASSRTKTVSPPPASIQTSRDSKDQAATPPAKTSKSSRRRAKNKTKTEADTPEVPVSLSPRRLRSSGVMPTTSSAKKNPQGNPTPESWETAPKADKMMSQMKEASMSWSDITEAWNDNRNESDDEMSWRALSKRWGRIRERIGPWPGFDELLLDTLGAFNPKLDDDDFAQIANEVSSGLGWEVSSEACQVRYKALKESGKIDVKGKGRARK
ncbi:hypothetical protein N7516_007836 [Penicillium verrucosum]|uniref:uncharacterized protein n=1 Tax=Penicillium verrucosum TaxID=60171 RepID=UPI0025450270|nr:uncharacterized protein N7516_007836 [Penicillium verrucosum]KAJ5926063.1 hypothetical protein N7516_007836 [Penicillium verrucosum]